MRTPAWMTLALVAAATPARADDDNGHLTADTVYAAPTQGPEELASVSSLLRFRWYGHTATWAVDWGLAFASLDTLGENFGMGNPLIGGHFQWDTDRSSKRLRLGLGLPLANISEVKTVSDAEDAALDLATFVGAAASRGLWDYWLWFPETTSLVAAADYWYDAGGGVELTVDGGLGLLFHTGDQVEGVDDNGLFQVALDARWMPGAVGGGLRAFAVVELLADVKDETQLAVEPHVDFRVGPLTGAVAATVPLDEPLGSGLEEPGRIGWHLTLGGAL